MEVERERYELHYQDESHLETNPYLCRVWHRIGTQPTVPAVGINRRVTVFGSTEAFGGGRVEVVCAGQDSACFLCPGNRSGSVGGRTRRPELPDGLNRSKGASVYRTLCGQHPPQLTYKGALLGAWTHASMSQRQE